MKKSFPVPCDAFFVDNFVNDFKKTDHDASLCHKRTKQTCCLQHFHTNRT